MKIPAKDFYFFTLAELFDAIEGHEEQERDKLQWHLWAVRRQIYYQLLSAGAKDLKEEEIYSLEIDEKLKEQHYRDMPLMKVIEDGK